VLPDGRTASKSNGPGARGDDLPVQRELHLRAPLLSVTVVLTVIVPGRSAVGRDVMVTFGASVSAGRARAAAPRRR